MPSELLGYETQTACRSRQILTLVARVSVCEAHHNH